ncbi:MAG: Spy/CpxP family protein refolding chaperone [Syntrophales bacterium]|nr:Spy/CpxP family protein refolding chaperone [Syntrophales bacterium]
MKKLTFVLGVILLAAAVASNALAYHDSGGMGPGAWYGFGFDDRTTANLNLTEEQTTQIRGMREALLKEIVPLQNRLYAKRNELKLLWLQKTPVEEKITAANKEVRTLRGQIQEKMNSHRLAIMKILTPEQQTKVHSYGNGRGYGFRGVRGACEPGYGRGPAYGPHGNW